MEEVTIDDDLDGNVDDGLTGSMKANLKDAFNWMRIVAMISFGVLSMIVVLWFKMIAEVPGQVMSRMGGPIIFLVLILAGEVLLLLTLYKAGAAYKAYVSSNSKVDLEKAFLKQKQFWLATGILAIIGAFFFLIGFAQAISMSGYSRGPFY